MKAPFKPNEIPDSLRPLYLAEEWTLLIERCEALLEQEANDHILLCLTWALIQEAFSIHVDDVKETAVKCLELLNNLTIWTRPIERFRKDLAKVISIANKQERAINQLRNKPLNELSFSEKKELAFQLSDLGGIENCRLAAELYAILEKQCNAYPDKFYNLGMYALNLFRSGQIQEAESNFQNLLKWDYNRGPGAYPFFISYLYYEKLKLLKDNPVEFEQVWKEALSNSVVKKEEYFPYARPIQDEFLKIALTHNLSQITGHLKDIYNKHRSAQSISPSIKALLESIKK